jgi:hypothetical protein
MFSPNDGTQDQASITGCPANTCALCDNKMAKLAAVMAPATLADSQRRWAPLTAVSRLPKTKGNKTTSNNTGTPKNLHEF